MATNSKYTPAPQRDSLDSRPYTQSPPSYQATSGSTGGLLDGQPRYEDDNVPDDFKFGNSVAETTLPIRMQFIRKVYFILSLQILFTTVVSCVSFVSDSYRTWIQSHPWLVLVSAVSALAFMGPSSKVELVYGAVTALLFSAYVLVDTQLIMRHYHVEEEIAAAISLYLDIVNLFLAILRILNSQSSD
ncbi:conserved hypothetical protein [Histoplasma mississippiense (nom. inval.)]|uniref:conserved hypothetical protein n=1 Tax=Ajellomyces capsulatus (strain NAm1 / WU24) TaxID=2059318 RepID=UPI000157B497|nr:conserved hypothetical protein [Histoplasma mississippiense (nom. inval.)]EDN02790.1 conserved hypothetical protein [Histoplasma mississippiense (nom. inval.)]